MTRRRWIIGFVIFVVLIGIIAAACDRNEESAVVQAPTPAPTATPEPQPTEPPVPTPTTSPTPITEPTQSAAAMPTPEPIVIDTPIPQSMPTATPVGTLTVEENLRAFILCERLRVDVSMLWGQAPGTIYDADPRTSGRLQEGDYIRLLMEPNQGGLLRIKVFPHDYRTVGNSNDQVWIDWRSLIQHRLDTVAFVCES